MTHVIPGTGGSREPDTRFSSSHCAVRTLLGRSGSRRGTHDKSGGNTFTLEMQNVPVVDQPRWPALDSITTPARMTFKMVWKSTGEPVKYDDSSRHFRFTGTRASCQLEAQVEVPSIGFSWKSDPLNTSKCDFAILGDEVNGRYYDS